MSSAEELLQTVQTQLNKVDVELQEWNINYFRHQKNRYLCDLEFFKKHYRGGPILEIGSSPYHFLMLLQSSGYDAVGIDLAPERASRIIEENGLRISKCDIERERLPFEDQSIDFILLNEVFEHLRIDPLFVLSEINRVLRPGGQLMLATPNLYSLGNIYRFLRGKDYNNPYAQFAKLRSHGFMGHIREYSTREMREFLKASGFEIQTVAYRDFRRLRGGAPSVGTLLYNLKYFLYRACCVPQCLPNQAILARKSQPISHLSPLEQSVAV